MSQKPYTTAEFIRDFNKLAPHKHRYDVFRDFVTVSAISIYNVLAKNESYEAEYIKIVGQYKKEEVMQFSHLLGNVAMMLDPAPSDVLGEIYMDLGLGNAKSGQYFTPWPVADLMAQITYGEELSNLTKPFVTLSEPCCGSGVMVLAFAKTLISKGHNPCEKMWAECIDLDRMTALMCYIQLSLWNIPAIVHVGDSLLGESREAFATPAHHLGCWDSKLKMATDVDAVRDILNQIKKDWDNGSVADENALSNTSTTLIDAPQTASQMAMQFDFDF